MNQHITYCCSITAVTIALSNMVRSERSDRATNVSTVQDLGSNRGGGGVDPVRALLYRVASRIVRTLECDAPAEYTYLETSERSKARHVPSHHQNADATLLIAVLHHRIENPECGNNKVRQTW